MKGQGYATEAKIRMLREVDGGKSVLDVCREKNIAEQTFYRWKRGFGMMKVSEARRLKELECENTELKKMLAEELLKNRGLLTILAEYTRECHVLWVDRALKAADVLHWLQQAIAQCLSKHPTHGNEVKIH